MRGLRWIVAAAVGLSVLVGDAHAWREGGVMLVGDPARPANSHELHVIPDLAGGAGVVWIDARASTWALHAQRVSSGGFREWTPGGLECVRFALDEEAFLLRSSKTTFLVRRTLGATHGPYRLSPLRPDGLPRTDFPPGGLDVSTPPGPSMIAVAEMPIATCDGSPGPESCAVVPLVGLVSDPVGAQPGEVRLQVWDRDTHDVWPASGLVVGEIPGEFDGLQVVPDAGVHAWAVWVTKPANGHPAGVHVARADMAEGRLAPGWSLGGRVVTSMLPTFVRGIADGVGGLYVVWKAQVTSGWKTFVQHVQSNGSFAPGWPPVGLEIGVSPEPFGVDAASDGLGGFYVTSVDAPDLNSGVREVRVRRIGGDGTAVAGWPAEGVVLSTAPGAHATLHLSGAEGFHVVLEDWSFSSQSLGIRLLRRTATSAPAPGWPVAGVSVTAAGGAQNPQVVPDAAGGVIVAWTEFDVSDPQRVVAQLRAQRFGPTGSPTPEDPPVAPRLGAPHPQPSRASVSFSLRLAEPARMELLIVDVRGRRVRGMEAGELPAGHQELTWDGRDDGGREVDSGIYFARVRVGGTETRYRLVRVR